MARTTHSAVQLVGPFPATLARAAAEAITPVACNATDKEQVTVGSGVIVLLRNTGSTTRAVTFTSVADPQNRTGDVTDSIAAGKEVPYGPFYSPGWAQTDGKLYFEAAHAEIVCVCLRLP